MKVALIIPAFNAGATIDETLASVAAQTRLPDEVVVADDASSDDTAARAEAWADRLPIRVVRLRENAGPAAARNAAIAVTTSELLALLDSDDLLTPTHIEAMLAAYATTDDGVAVPNGLTFLPDGTKGQPQSAKAALPASNEQLHWLLAQNRVWAACLFSRRRFDAVGGFRTEFFGTEDWDLWIRMARAGAVLARPAESTFLYRLNHESVSSSDRLVDEKLKVLEAAAREGAASEQPAIARGRRKLLAAQQLNAAYELANEGRGIAARRAGLRATRGIRSVALRGVAMALAPRYFARKRAAVRFDPEVWLKRYGSA